jgi:hypothetical protein
MREVRAVKAPPSACVISAIFLPASGISTLKT